MDALTTLESHRLELQVVLDAAKTKAERNQLGQFATPTELATLICKQTEPLLPNNQPVRFLDPAFGTGAFYSALLQVFPQERIKAARGYEIDPHYGEEAKLLWRNRPVEIVIDDFTKTPCPVDEAEKYNLIICNPPYVRHHHLSSGEKKRLQEQAAEVSGGSLSGLSGLYVYFLYFAHAWLQEGGIAAWLIPSEFMDVNYGHAVRHYLTTQVTLLGIHRFNPAEVQFDDALVSSAVVLFRKQKPAVDHKAKFSLGGSLSSPQHNQAVPVADLKREKKWSRFPKNGVRSVNHSTPRLRDLFDIKRGVATGANQFFIVNTEDIRTYNLPFEMLTPILPSPRYLETDEIPSSENGTPAIKKRLFLITCDLSEEQVEQSYPALWHYLQRGREQGINERYLCRQRAIWYTQDKREPSPFLCTYMGRVSNGQTCNPFRFILNHSRAIAPNVYLNIYPKPPLARQLDQRPELRHLIWQSLRGIPPERLIGEGRVYGGELYKLEPKELGNLLITDIFDDEAITGSAGL